MVSGEFYELRGLSTDPKPTGNQVLNGSSFLEMDTGDLYVYDKANETWHKLGGE